MKAKKVFPQGFEMFIEIFRSKKSKKIFLGLKNWIFRAKKSKKIGDDYKKVVKKFGNAEKKKGRQKILGCLKKSLSKKFRKEYPKKNDFRHISEIYRIEQPFFRSKKAKKLVFRSMNAKK